MEIKALFDRALSEVSETHAFSSDREIIRNIRERAKNMDKKNEKKSRVLGIVCGVAGTAAVLTGAVFGLRFLAEHGGLKEGGIGAASGGSAYSAALSPAAETVDISELAGKTFGFSDMTATVDFAGYDGQYIRLDVTEKRKSEEYNCYFALELARRYDERERTGGVWSEDIDEFTRKVVYLTECAMPDGDSKELIPASYSAVRNNERVNDLVVSVHKDRNSIIMQPVPEGDLGGGMELSRLDITPFMIYIIVGYDNIDNVRNPTVSAIAADGTAVPMKGFCESVEVSPDKTEALRLMYIPDDPGIDLTAMKGFEVNGRVFEITAEPFAPFTTVVQTGITMTTAAVPEADITTSTADLSDDTTAPAADTEDEIRAVSVLLDKMTKMRDGVLADKESCEKKKEDAGKELDVIIQKADTAETEEEKRALEEQRKYIEDMLDGYGAEIASAELSLRYCDEEIAGLENRLAELHRQLEAG